MTEPGDATAGVDDAVRAPQDVVRGWRDALAAIASPDPLLDLGDDHPGTLDVTRAHPSGMAQLLAGRTTRLSALFREPAALSRARASARDVRLAASEMSDAHGVDGCRLALGVMRAHAVGVDGPARISAPVLLRRATLVPRGAGSDDDVELGSDLVANPALLRWLASAGVHVDGEELVGLTLGRHGLDPRPALRLLEREARHLGGLEVSPRLVLGLFADIVPAMVAAVDRVAAGLDEHDLPAALAGDPAAVQRVRAADTGSVDGPLPPVALDLDTDAAQALARVLAGGSVRVEAPPGTGATQLVAAVVAGAAARGWRTLLVCPQRHEVTDVVARLAEVGLDQLVDATAAGVQRPAPGATRTGGSDPADGDPADGDPADGDPADGDPAGTGTAQPSAAEQPTAAAAQRADDPALWLQRRHDALHLPDPWWDVSLLDALRAVAALAGSAAAPGTSARMPLDAALRVRGDRDGVRQRLRSAGRLGAFDPGRDLGPWQGAGVRDADHAARVVEVVHRLADTGLPALREAAQRAATAAGLTPPATTRIAAEQVELLLAVRDTLQVFSRGVFERPVEAMVAATGSAPWRREQGHQMGLLERRRWRRQAQELLRPGQRPGDLHAALERAARQREHWQALGGAGGWPHVPDGLADADDALARVRADLALLEPVLATTPDGGDLEHADLAGLQRRVSRLAATSTLLPDLGEETALLAALRDTGLGDLLADLRARQVTADRVGEELELCWWRTVLEALAGRQGPDAAAELTGAGLARAVQLGTDAAAAGSAAVGAAALAAFPASGPPACVALGPYQPAESDAGYDLVVLAGAHRTGTAEAAPALALAPRAVVVGDPQGAAPTVPRLGVSRPDPQAPPRSSVLADTGGLLATVRLGWQHRLTAELAALADVVAEAGEVGETEHGDDAAPAGAGDAPAARVRVAGPLGRAALRLEHVPEGTGRLGGGGAVDSSDEEVARVVRLALEHVLHRPQESLAVITLSRAHARRVADALRTELPEHPAAARALARTAVSAEPFVVTDCSRAEDAVRDAVLLTVGFGRTPHGRVVHQFGALDLPDGAQQLRLALTRARRRVTVVSSLLADDLDTSRLRRPGGRALRALLATVADDSAAPGAAPAPDVLLDDLAARLVRRGARVGRGGASGEADLQVRPDGDAEPVAVVSDVPEPAPGLGLLDRHVRIPQQLRRHGWRVVRVAAIDLFSDPDAVAERVLGSPP